ncbi:MAG: DUF1934 domain-containing protein [Schaedlerella sp.]|nr:DUF1934 domain-containing protein [Schaedlerella sp.]
MTKEVIIEISGIQESRLEGEEGDPGEELVVVMPATYYYKNGKHYVLYDEVVEGSSEGIKNTLKITGNKQVDMMKSGATNAHMVFEHYKKTQTYYQTPFGQMLVSFYTTNMNVCEKEDEINIRINYEMEVDYQPFADCIIRINIRSKEAGNLEL